MSCVILALANQKGGTGKTTSTVNLGAALCELGSRVLVVDLDPQASLTLALGLDPDRQDRTIWSALCATLNDDEEPPSSALTDVIAPTEAGLDLVPTNIELSQADLDLPREPLGVYALRDALRPTRDTYDYVLIDCPPTLGILTTNALAAADKVIVPLQADYLALKGVNLLVRTIGKIQRRVNRDLEVAGVLLTQADLRTSHAKEIIAATRHAFQGKIHVFETVIPMSVRLKEAPVTKQSILTYDPKGTAAAAYRQLAKEVTGG